MLFDSHAHLNDARFDEDREELISSLNEKGVDLVVNPGACMKTSAESVELANKYDFIYAAVGVHPHDVKDLTEADIQELKRMATENEKVVAIGEIGLDLYWDKTFLKEQILVFEKQIEWALEYGFPIVIHSREAFEYIYKVMEPYKNTSLTGIFHSFTGTSEEAAKLLEFEGFMLGINGVVTFKKSTLPETLTTVPLERIVLETDSPYLAPVPNRGKRNESANVKDTLMKVAEIYQITPEHVAEVTSVNALKVFGIRK